MKVFVKPLCPICEKSMHSAGTVNGKTSFQCMNLSCTNLARYTESGEKYGNDTGHV